MNNQKGLKQNSDLMKMPKSQLLTPDPTQGPHPGACTADIKGRSNAIQISVTKYENNLRKGFRIMSN